MSLVEFTERHSGRPVTINANAIVYMRADTGGSFAPDAKVIGTQIGIANGLYFDVREDYTTVRDIVDTISSARAVSDIRETLAVMSGSVPGRIY